MKPLILLTNDDGIQSPGLKAAAEAVLELGEIVIAAPAYQQTSMGKAFPRTKELGRIEPEKLILNGKKAIGYKVYGSPAYAVAHGILELSSRKPDICISGVNYGENLGTNLTCSGTVGAILESDTYGVLGIAFSVCADIGIQRSMEYPVREWDEVKKIVKYWVEKSLCKGMEYGASMLNINIPEPVPKPECFCYTRQSHQGYFSFSKPQKRDRHKAYEIPTVIDCTEDHLAKDDDIYAIRIRKIVSVTPIVHDLTAKNFGTSAGESKCLGN